MRNRDELLDSLAGGLEPVKPAPDLRLLAGLWLAFSALYVVLVTHWFGPIRPTALEQLQSQPRFLLEMVVGALAAFGLAFSAVNVASPGALHRLLAGTSLVLGILWLAGFLVGLVSPALEPSMLGKRGHCFIETFVYALPPLVALLYLQQRLYPLRPAQSAVVAGLAAGVLPALYMQVACMYQPAHILAFHVGPGLAVAAIAPVLLSLCQRLRR